MSIVDISGMEEIIQEEVDLFKVFLNKNICKPVDFLHQFNLPIINALWRITVGDRFEYDDPKLTGILVSLLSSALSFTISIYRLLFSQLN